ncbi:hypothetical protein AB0L82_09135 [Nocardia sp. NPDC052001]|uniref:hypothetical protein n=1 Tax=unclassified Nocardia TaxID=2637762 RepID=UPI00343669B3
MASRDISVTVGEDDWRALVAAAEAAGMGVEAYVSWCVRILALQAQPGGGKRAERLGHVKARRRKAAADEGTEAAAWAETFTERLSHRADRRPRL